MFDLTMSLTVIVLTLVVCLILKRAWWSAAVYGIASASVIAFPVPFAVVIWLLMSWCAIKI